MVALGQVGEDKLLPVAVEVVLAHRRRDGDAAAQLPRFDQDVCFGIVSQRLEMSDAFDGAR